MAVEGAGAAVAGCGRYSSHVPQLACQILIPTQRMPGNKANSSTRGKMKMWIVALEIELGTDR